MLSARKNFSLRHYLAEREAIKRLVLFDHAGSEPVAEPTWSAISTTFEGRKIEGEYALSGHLVKVRHEERERAADRGNSDPKTLARQLLRELAEEGHA